MPHAISIDLQSQKIGSLALVEPEQGLIASRTANGISIQVPAILTLERPSRSELALVLEGLTASFRFSCGQEGLGLGEAKCRSRFQTDYRDLPIVLDWEWSLPALAKYESARQGRAPAFDVSLYGDLRYVLPGDPGREPVSTATTFASHGQAAYSRDTWVHMLRELHIRDAVLVELPIQPDPPASWEGVWSALADARDAFDKGGSTGWKGCVANVRLALEEWQKIEKEDQGPGWKRPATSDLTSRSKTQRFDNIRWHLLQFAHLAPHTRADDWTRDDALVALATLTSLLASRKP